MLHFSHLNAAAPGARLASREAAEEEGAIEVRAENEEEAGACEQRLEAAEGVCLLLLLLLLGLMSAAMEKRLEPRGVGFVKILQRA